ncbi:MULTISPECIES: FAD-linked oxidase C-terminal domain-containing protein [unclassified Paenibacillus]|uniref:FAD-binding oxidoreductase n=1 Tax=unclassified Paenibacillus TaxID=185978 RepID=UPI001AE4BC2B|nr:MULTISPECIES: FAD-linked oxidase C-terminal domain-containing protein [unclassified Paenibacillus]MBP1155758.1 glycolate oxidase [Paenibacillus sp. PvP091]MBP1168856.1 glycolate oxidase [Paenibacillus sp. PvR098]MBP2439884.1 glycolate oxidase [Paenibacillus sp. PvP052]
MNQEQLVAELKNIVGLKEVIHKPDDLIAYECDGFTIVRARPRAVVFPNNTDHVAAVVKLLHNNRIPFIPRGAGTGLSGGATPINGEVLISLVKMNRLLSVDFKNRTAVVEPGHVNLKLTNAIAHEGYYYAPDPSSGMSCTIGGNVGENAGGPHCLKYGVTSNHVLGVEMVLPDGEIVTLGGTVPDMPGYDVTGLIVGSEGTMGIVTKIFVRILKKPQGVKTIVALYDSVDDASQTVSAIIAEGIIPGALEMMDRVAIEGVEAGNYPVGYPKDLAAVLIIELDGLTVGMEAMAEQIVDICTQFHVREVRVAQTDQERTLWWANRKTAFGAMGRISPDYMVQDGVIPRSRLPEVLQRISDISVESGLRIANVFHAGDGNLHPLILFNAANPGETELAVRVGSEVLQVCADVGGSITGEHGVGIEKQRDMIKIFTPEEIAAQVEVMRVFNPHNLCNPDKLFPKPSRCVEVKRAAHTH